MRRRGEILGKGSCCVLPRNGVGGLFSNNIHRKLRVRGGNVRLGGNQIHKAYTPRPNGMLTRTLASTTRKFLTPFTVRSGLTTPFLLPLADIEAVLVGCQQETARMSVNYYTWLLFHANRALTRRSAHVCLDFFVRMKLSNGSVFLDNVIFELGLGQVFARLLDR